MSGWREITQAHLDGFAAVSGDDNPIHVDPTYAATTPFKVPVAHGMFLFALVVAAVRQRWPSAVLVEQQLKFPSPTPVGAHVCVILDELASGAGRLTVRTEVQSRDGTVGLTGQCLLVEQSGRL